MYDSVSINYLRALEVPLPVAQEFASNHSAICSTPFGICEMPPDVVEKFNLIKEEYGNSYEIYHVIISVMYGCEIVDYLLYPFDPDENAYLLADTKRGYVLSYCWNKSIPEFSSAGDIKVKYNPETKSIIRIG